MKKLFLSLVALICAMTANAQQTEATTATLQTGDVSKVFYVINVLTSALAEAQYGSIINLSSGSFNVSCHLYKSV